MATERPPECPSMNRSIKDVASVYDKTMEDKKRPKTKDIIVLFFSYLFSSAVCWLLSRIFFFFIKNFSEKKVREKWKNTYGKPY